MSLALALGLLIPAGFGSLIMTYFCCSEVAMHGTARHDPSYYVNFNIMLGFLAFCVGLPTLGLAVAALAVGGFKSSPASAALSYGGLAMIVLPLVGYCVLSLLHLAYKHEAVKQVNDEHEAEREAELAELASWAAFELICSACGRRLPACSSVGVISFKKINVQIGGERVECGNCLDPTTIGRTYISTTVLSECKKREARVARAATIDAAAPDAVQIQVEDSQPATASSSHDDLESGLVAFQGHSAAGAVPDVAPDDDGKEHSDPP